MAEAWKEHERRVARIIGGQRTGNRGQAAGDAVSTWCVAEAKQRRVLPEWLEHALDQARAASGPSQLPIAVLHAWGKRSDGDIVCMRMADFRAWFGEIPGLGDGPVVDDKGGQDAQAR